MWSPQTRGPPPSQTIANGVSIDYGHFWLGDAFASGGSAGYDHKKMGITAKGAWESVKRHFRETGKDIQNEDFTVHRRAAIWPAMFSATACCLSEAHQVWSGAFNHHAHFRRP